MKLIQAAFGNAFIMTALFFLLFAPVADLIGTVVKFVIEGLGSL